jgi:hypothetical protein
MRYFNPLEYKDIHEMTSTKLRSNPADLPVDQQQNFVEVPFRGKIKHKITEQAL